MTIKRRDPEFLHPDTVAQLQGPADEEAAKHSPIVRERDGVFMQQRRIGRRVRCREVEASGVPALETGALHAAAEAEFGRLLPLLTAGFPGGGVSGSGRDRDVDPRRHAGRRSEALRGSSRDGRRPSCRQVPAVLPELRAADGAARPGRQDVRDAPRRGPGQAALLLLPQVRRRNLSFGPRAASGGQGSHARGGSHLRRRRRFRQLRGSEPQALESGRRGGVEGDSPAPQRQDWRRDAGV